MAPERLIRGLARRVIPGPLRRRLRAFPEEMLAPESSAPSPEDYAAEKSNYERQREDFHRRTQTMNVPGLEHFYWYHAVDLGNGLVTPGDYDYRDCLDAFHFPPDMTGLTVLDVGSATGFFAFEFERRGARVVSVELPSLSTWDMVAAERASILRSLIAWHQVETEEEAYYRHLTGPFEFCRAQLKSRVERRYSTVYDLSPTVVGQEGFDWVFLGDVLPHLFNPLKALDVVAGLCRGTLVISGDLVPTGADDIPLVRFVGDVDPRSWWGFNKTALVAVLQRLGFRTISAVGTHAGVLRRAWLRYERHVFHARKS